MTGLRKATRIEPRAALLFRLLSSPMDLTSHAWKMWAEELLPPSEHIVVAGYHYPGTHNAQKSEWAED